MKKKIISVILAIVTVISCFAVAFNAYGKIYELELGVKTTGVIDGEDDLIRFSFTPEESGTYSFLSYNVPATEAYLFVKEVDPETGYKEFVQLAYSNSDPNYQENEHSNRQFCLTYHLEKGVKYYFDAGWYLSDTRVSGTITVMLRCDEYDVVFDRIEATCPIMIDVYSDGSFSTDSNGEQYFLYNLSKVIANTTVTLYYPDGRVSSSTGSETIDGYTIYYNHNQYYEHWYPQTDANYTGNYVTVRVLGQSVQMEIQIVTSSRHTITGRITDMLGNPLNGARLLYGSTEVAETDENGEFSFTYPPGQFTFTAACENGIARTVVIVVSTSGDNDYTDRPIALCDFDYVSDSVINAKDYAEMLKTLPGDELEAKQETFLRYINFAKSDYPPLNLQ